MVHSKDSSDFPLPESKESFRRNANIFAPKYFFLGPVFAATKQTRSREVTIGDCRYMIGECDPLDPERNAPALDVTHARAIFTLLSFRGVYDETRLIRFSLNEFCQRYASTNGGRYSRTIKKILSDLTKSYIRITDLKSNIDHTYRLIERVDIEGRPPRRKDSRAATSRQREIWFNGCTLSPEFCGILHQIAELRQLNLRVFTTIRSQIAQAIYLYMPSRAYHHSENDPFEITATKLLEQISFPVPAQKCRRHKLFNQHHEKNRSILQQLNTLETLTGRLRVKFVETADGSDWKFQFWIEPNESKRKLPRTDSKLVKAYLRSGRPRDWLNTALANIEPLNGYEIDLLQAAGVEIGKNRRCFEVAKAILKSPLFNTLLAEAKGDFLEGKTATKNPTARLIWRIRETISTPPKTGLMMN